MANQSIPIPKTSDAIVIEFFEKIARELQFVSRGVQIQGLDAEVALESPEFQEIKERNLFSIRQVNATRSNSTVSYLRNSDPNRFGYPDQIQISTHQNQIGAREILRLNEKIAESFLRVPTSIETSLQDPGAFAAVITSHQEMIGRLEYSLEQIAQKFAAERLKIQSEQDAFLKGKQEEFLQRERGLRAQIEEEKQKLEAREKSLDDRDNMHARRAIREDLKKRLQEYAVDFTLTTQTKQLRWPLHVTVWLSLLALGAAIAYCWWLMGQHFDLTLLIKSSLLTIAALGILTWYIRWMNRWFDQHADAEFRLKQFGLDVDRASWVVETAMEWRASQHGAIPSHLLESISRNLFNQAERQGQDEIQPADYLASALLGNASRARIKLGDAELDYNRGALKKAAKSVEE